MHLGSVLWKGHHDPGGFGYRAWGAAGQSCSLVPSFWRQSIGEFSDRGHRFPFAMKVQRVVSKLCFASLLPPAYRKEGV